MNFLLFFQNGRNWGSDDSMSFGDSILALISIVAVFYIYDIIFGNQSKEKNGNSLNTAFKVIIFIVAIFIVARIYALITGK